jgi:uncharacterized membrane protein
VITGKLLAILLAVMVLIIAAVFGVLHYVHESVAQPQITHARIVGERGREQGQATFDQAWKPSTTKAPAVQNPWSSKQ